MNILHYKNMRVGLSTSISNLARDWRNDRNVREWCRQFTLISFHDHSTWLDKIDNDETIKMFGIKHKGESVGVCGLTGINLINRVAEFSLYISPLKRRQGFAKDALISLFAHGFQSFNLNRIWGETFDYNPAGGLFTSIGMTGEGSLRDSYFRNGKYIDSHIFSMLEHEFKEKYGLMDEV